MVQTLMMTQISQNRQHHDILESLLEEAGSEIYIKSAFRYVQCAMPVDFYTIGAAAVRYGEIAIGYKKMHKDRKSFDIVLNPPKGQTEIFSQVDSIIVIAEN